MHTTAGTLGCAGEGGRQGSDELTDLPSILKNRVPHGAEKGREGYPGAG